MKAVRRRVAVVGAVMSLGFVAAMPSPAGAADAEPLAYEVDYAVNDTMNSTAKACANPSSSHPVNGCVQPYGDVLWVLDREADGHGVDLAWRQIDSRGNTIRSGECINNRGQAAGWTLCNKNFTEGATLVWYLRYTGSNGRVTLGPYATTV